MSSARFDCSQFISFDDSYLVTREDFIDFEQLGFRVLMGDEIEESKINYIQAYAKSNIVELVNRDLFGYFRDRTGTDQIPKLNRDLMGYSLEWKENIQFPKLYQDFTEALKLFHQRTGIQKFMLICIPYASVDREDDKIFIGKTRIERTCGRLAHYCNYDLDENLFLTIQC